VEAVWTIGHWTCPEEVFLGELHRFDIETVADVRSYPASRANPQYGQDALRGWLDRAGVRYVHLAALGGRRRKQDVDPYVNAGWHNQSFHNYADYGLLPDYERGIADLISLALTSRVACLCSEPMPWRCHRLLIANTLAARGIAVRHLMVGRTPQAHELGRWGAQPQLRPDGTITYPGGPDQAAMATSPATPRP
jgi:uncharacterized protein (DUF488 family)